MLPEFGPTTVVTSVGFDRETRRKGMDWPTHAHTMVGLERLRNLRLLVGQVLEDGTPGDFLEAGVWRGGASIFMRALLKVHGILDRRIWAVDSFAGLPPPNDAEFPADRGDRLHEIGYLAVPLEEVRRNFQKYGMLDSQVEFVRGFFKDTLPGHSRAAAGDSPSGRRHVLVDDPVPAVALSPSGARRIRHHRRLRPAAVSSGGRGVPRSPPDRGTGRRHRRDGGVLATNRQLVNRGFSWQTAGATAACQEL